MSTPEPCGRLARCHPLQVLIVFNRRPLEVIDIGCVNRAAVTCNQFGQLALELQSALGLGAHQWQSVQSCSEEGELAGVVYVEAQHGVRDALVAIGHLVGQGALLHMYDGSAQGQVVAHMVVQVGTHQGLGLGRYGALVLVADVYGRARA